MTTNNPKDITQAGDTARLKLYENYLKKIARGEVLSASEQSAFKTLEADIQSEPEAEEVFQTTADPTDAIISQISGYIRVGADYILATAACGITEAQATDWEAKATKAFEDNQDNIYKQLYDAIRTSKAQAEMIALQRLAAEGGAAGARWLLEKVHPEKYKGSKTGNVWGVQND